ncbi:MAG: cyclophilin-like fold protein [Candidatus Methylomirabilia bacterium]
MAEQRIKITAGTVEGEALLGEGTTAKAIWEALPLSAEAETWGDEIYFPIPLRLKAENPKEVVESGDLGYWPPGQAFCIFFGPTPASRDGEIRPASAVTVFGRVTGNPKVFKKVSAGTTVRVTRA